MELLIAIVTGVILYEFYAWLPWISEHLVDRAVSQLPPEEQERFREEWKAHLNALPNTGGRIVHAIHCNFASGAIEADFIDSQMAKVYDSVDEVLSQHRSHVEILDTLVRTVDGNTEKLRDAYQSAESIVKSLRQSLGQRMWNPLRTCCKVSR